WDRSSLGLCFQFHPTLGDGVAHLDVVARDQSDGQLFREVEARKSASSGVNVARLKSEFSDAEAGQHLADVADDIGMALPGQLGNLAAAHGQGGVGVQGGQYSLGLDLLHYVYL